jgi:hypothetical protein
MSKIMVWKSDSDGKLFEDKLKYQKHLRKLAAARRKKKKMDAFEAARVAIFAEMRETCYNPDQIIEFIKAHWHDFCLNAIRHYMWKDGKKIALTDLEWFTITDFHWGAHVSNSHSAPFGKKTNWGSRDVNEPTSYPGWTGNIRYRPTDYDTSSYHFGSDAWVGTGINTGSGGYAREYYYDVKLFADDWPAMRKSMECGARYKLMMQHTQSETRSIEAIATAMFDTAEKIAAFDLQYPDWIENCEKAHVWAKLSDDKRPLGRILKEEIYASAA